MNGYRKLTVIIKHNGDIISRRGHLCDPEKLKKLEAKKVNYHVLDMNSRGRGGESRIESIEGWGRESLLAAAKLA